MNTVGSAMRHRWRLSQRLVTARTRAGRTQRDVARNLGWSLSKMIRMESGQIGVSRTDLMALLDLYQVTDPEQILTAQRLAVAGRRLALIGDPEVLSRHHRAFLDYETAAARVCQFDGLLVPRLVRTDAYDEALTRAGADTDPEAMVAVETVEADAVGRWLRVQQDRRAQVLRRGVPIQIVFDEAALHRQVTGPHGQDVMVAQYQRLRELAEENSATIQVIPYRVGAYPGMSQRFSLLEFSEPDEPCVVFDEVSGLCHDNPTSTEAYRRLFTTLTTLATAPTDLHTTVDHIHAQQPCSPPPQRHTADARRHRV